MPQSVSYYPGGPVLADERLCLGHISIFRSELLAGVCLACDFVVPHSAFVGLSFFFMMGLRCAVDLQSSQSLNKLPT